MKNILSMLADMHSFCHHTEVGGGWGGGYGVQKQYTGTDASIDLKIPQTLYIPNKLHVFLNAYASLKPLNSYAQGSMMVCSSRTRSMYRISIYEKTM